MSYCNNLLKKRFSRIHIALICLAISTGCATASKEVVGYEYGDDKVVCNAYEEKPVKYDGSLWQESGPLSEMFMNPSARRIGDIVTISIVETSTATNQADTNTSRNSSISAQLNNLLGLENNTKFPLSGTWPLNPFGSVSGSASNSFKGSGTTNRSGNLAASITARVTEVMPNGNMKIIGKREITINNEKQYIALTGIIRPIDVSPENVVLSTYISDAKIVYTGSGVINDRQHPGWLTRVFDVVWPF